MQPAFSMSVISAAIAFAMLNGCSGQQPALNQPVIDMSPVDCGYKWFQTGRAPPAARDCALPRDNGYRETEEALAVAHAWEIEAERCPATCPASARDRLRVLRGQRLSVIA